VGSKLEAFSAKNPFKPMKDLAKASTTTGDGTAGSPAEDEGDGGSFNSAGGSDVGGDLAGGTGGSGGSGGSDGSGSTPGGSGDGSTPSAPGIPHTEWFRYAADFSFGPSGHTEKFKGPQSFTPLPDSDHPSIVFLGVSDDGKHALFLIADPAFEAQGEGKCTPKGACQFVSLATGDSNDEETFTSIDGSVSYELKLDRIRREKLESDADGDPVVPAPKAKAADASEAAGEGADEAGEASGAAVPEVFAAGPGFVRESR
jgi:hypothetical protein